MKLICISLQESKYRYFVSKYFQITVLFQYICPTVCIDISRRVYEITKLKESISHYCLSFNFYWIMVLLLQIIEYISLVISFLFRYRLSYSNFITNAEAINFVWMKLWYKIYWNGDIFVFYVQMNVSITTETCKLDL